MKRTLKEFYIFEEKHNGILYDLHELIQEGSYAAAKELVKVAKLEYKIPVGSLRETVETAFAEKQAKLKEALSFVLED